MFSFRKTICLVSFVVVLGLAVGLTSEANAALPGLVGWWKLDEMAGTIAYDSSGLGNHGTLGPEGDPKWVAGYFGGALELDGNNDYVAIDAVADEITTDTFSISAWIKTTQTGTDNVVIGSNHSGSGHDVVLGVHNDGFLVEADNANVYPPKINDNQWHHIAYVRDGNTAYAYTDGVLVGTETPTKDPWTEPRWSIGQEWDSGPSDEYDGLVDDVHFFNRPLTHEEVIQVMIGVPPGAASEPSPEDEAIDVPREVVLSWTPGEFTPPVNGHKIYLSESFNDVNDRIGGITQSANSYARPQRLDFNTTYYWRVEEVNGPPDYTVHESHVWSFTTEPIAYPIAGDKITATASSTSPSPGMGPENTINGSGLDVNDLHSTDATAMWLSSDEPNGAWIEYELDKVYKLHEMWVWNQNGVMESVIGFGIKEATIEYSTNGTDYTILGTTHEFARAPSADGYEHNTTVDFGDAAAKYVRLTANSNWGGLLPQYGLSEVRFFSIPVCATEPQPESGATDVDVDVTLGFRVGREAAEHDVYISTDEQAVIDSNVPVSIVTETSYGPLSLDLGETYYWKINEVNEAETTTTWQGDIWNFTTYDHIVVGGFEDYNDYPPNEIWNTWIDGYGISTNGATVGYPNPDWNQGEHYVETAIVHSGDQAMPFFYSNTGTATDSEGERTFAVPQDWTKANVQTLALHFYGTADNTGQLYVKINGSKVVYDGDASNLARAGWQAWNIDLASFGTNLQSVTTLAIGIDGNGASGTLYFDDIRLYSYSRQFITPVEPNASNLILHYEFEGTINDSTGANHGTAFGAPIYVAGKVSQALQLDGVDDYVAIQNFNYASGGHAEVSVCAWIRTSNENNQIIASFDRNEYWRLEINGNGGGPGQVGWDVMTDSGQVDYGSTGRVDDGRWHHVAGVFDNGTLTIYLDGNPEVSASGGSTYGSGTARYGYVGLGSESTSFNADPRTPADFFDGAVDDVRIYNHVLSPAEIAWLAGRTEPFDKPF